MTQERTISFAEWGEQWMDLVITPELVEANLRRIIKPDVQVDTTGISGSGSVAVGSVERLNSGQIQREIVFCAPLGIDLDLSIGLAGLYSESYTIQVSTELQLTLRAQPMLVLWLDVAPVKADAINVRTSGQNGLSLVQQFTDLDGQIKRYIATSINKQIDSTAEQRTINVLERVRQSNALKL